MQTSAVDSWLESWAKSPRALVHPDDAEYLKQKEEELCRRKRNGSDLYAPKMSSQDCALTSRTGQFRCELGAMPYIGNIKQAQIFLLMINPGVSCGDCIDLGNQRTSRLFEENKKQERATCFALEPNAAQGWSPYYLSKVFGGVLSQYRAAQRDKFAPI